MTETTTAKVREEQVTGLTVENAHRVTMIREKGTDHPPVPFHFRKEHHGTGNYVHLYGNPEDRNELHSRDFKDWEAVAFKHPGYLEDMWKQACDAYAWSSFDPEIRGETDIMIYGEELHNDLQLMQEEKRDTYIAAYRKKLSAQLSALSRCANPMVTDSITTGRRIRTEAIRTATRSSAIGGKRFLKPPDGKMKPHDRRKKNWKRHGRRSNATSRAAPTPSTGLTPDNAGVITVPCSSAAS